MANMSFGIFCCLFDKYNIANFSPKCFTDIILRNYHLLKSKPKKEEKKEAPAPYGLPPGYAMPRAA